MNTDQQAVTAMRKETTSMTPAQQAVTAMLEGTGFFLSEATDRKKQPTPVLVRYMTMAEVQALSPGDWYEFHEGGRIKNVRVSSIKWRKNVMLGIKFKYGLKSYWDWTPEECTQYLIVRLQ